MKSLPSFDFSLETSNSTLESSSCGYSSWIEAVWCSSETSSIVTGTLWSNLGGWVVLRLYYVSPVSLWLRTDTGWDSVVAARLWEFFAGEKKVSILYFFIMEHRCTDVILLTALLTLLKSSSSSSTFASNMLSRPETKELYFTLRRFEIRLARWLRLDRRIKFEARKSSDGRWYKGCFGGR